MYFGQRLKRERWRKEALWASPLRGGGAFIPNRIDEDAHAINFNQRGRMTKPSNAQA
jgi:hypothetical protein